MLFELDNSYTFNSISKTILEPTYRNMKVVSYLSFKQAVKYSGVFNDVVTVRQQLINETGLQLMDATKVKYWLFENEYGKEVLLAEDWIDHDSITLITSIVLNLSIKDITDSDAAIIMNAIRGLGYNHFDVNIEEVSATS